MRCLALADELRRRGAGVRFICREYNGNMITTLQTRGFEVFQIPLSLVSKCGAFWEDDSRQTAEILGNLGSTVDWLIIDHYALGSEWEKLLRPYAGNIMVIDDLADRSHDCDLLLDQNYYKDNEERYLGLVPDRCRLLLGIRFVLLRREFVEARKTLRKHDGTIGRLFVFLGSTDPENVTERVLDAYLLIKDKNIAVDVVVGDANPHKDRIMKKCADLESVTLHCQVDNVAQLMSRADLAIGACGITTWERCALGLPALVVSIAPNQDSNAENMEAAGASIFLGKVSEVAPHHILTGIKKCFGDKALVISMSRESFDLVDTLGAQRVADEIYSI